MKRAMVAQARQRAVSVLAIGAILVVAYLVAAPAWSATQTDRPVKYPQWYTGIQNMSAADAAGRPKDALAIAIALEAAAGIPPQKAEGIRYLIVRYATEAKDYATAAAMTDRLLATSEGVSENNLANCVLLAVLQNHIARARECTKLYEAHIAAP